LRAADPFDIPQNSPLPQKLSKNHYIKKNGPFQCTHSKAWLGSGFYYWESFVENAHWWGSEGAKYSNGYVVCESSFDLDEEKCFNLVDNPDHLNSFIKTIEVMKETGLYKEYQTTVRRVIEFLKNKLKIFTYEATRVYGVNSLSFNSPYSKRIIFVYKEGKRTTQYLDLIPAIQVCFYSKSSLNLSGFEIIHPIEDADDYLV
jgi:hypothetical protein